MVTEVHILLTYNCSLRCKHCYVFSDQRAPGKISFSQVSRYLNDGRKMQGIEWIYFGGGEPFTQYPLLLKAIQRARKLNYRVGVETNGYFARTIEAGIRMLKPLKNMGVEDLRISNDRLHYKNPRTSPANNALSAAHELGIPTTEVRTSTPGVEEPIPYSSSRVDQFAEPSFMFAGRAAELLAEKYPGMEGVSLTSCPHPDLGNPERVFVDAYGFVQICPGIAIGNACQVPLNEILGNYEIQKHEILSVLALEGPAGLVKLSGLPADSKFADACHGCFSSRKLLIDQYPAWLGPRQVYGF
ncbi:MAG: radical SAM protein [Anaerolineales bacterium]